MRSEEKNSFLFSGKIIELVGNALRIVCVI